ncbi:MAG: cob(I)yrinic acid a,c-diamide adenosyltransferase [Rhodothermales bacterium]|nr:cob(I)yrinic acid a,c-diamide adenosyltransferase [Rhodothermales bacterium]
MKVYTKTGDDGTTGLFGGDRVRKDHARIEAYGTVDEANSFVGMARSAGPDDRLTPLLERIQGEMFVVGADLATPVSAKPVVPRVTPEIVERLERDIDSLEEDLSPLKTFILPGGTPRATALHAARTICRRAERSVIAAMEEEVIDPNVGIYLNRLSDFLFVAARWANHIEGVEDTPWMP